VKKIQTAHGEKMIADESTFKAVFETDKGKLVLASIERFIRTSNRLDADHPDPHAAVWKCAQHALLAFVLKKLGRGITDE
jgi:hypothetical protein